MSELTAEQQQQMLQMQALAQQQQQQQQMASVINSGILKDDILSVDPHQQVPLVGQQMPQVNINPVVQQSQVQVPPVQQPLTAPPTAQQQQPGLNPAGANTFFNDLLSPFFAPYGIDVSHFPLTNPPIFDSAMMVNQQGQPRRRISISNGQIGQITNHTNDDFFSSDQSHRSSVVKGGQDDIAVFSSGGVAPQMPQQQQQPVMQQQQQQQPPPQMLVSPLTPASTTAENIIPTNENGVPTQKLLYNNEVIFNPEAGPIPGTAAWKKARLLERNRVAASKCRQRKKAAQNQLKEDVQKYSRELEGLKSKVSHLQKTIMEVKSLAQREGLDSVLELLEKMEKVDIKNVAETEKRHKREDAYANIDSDEE